MPQASLLKKGMYEGPAFQNVGRIADWGRKRKEHLRMQGGFEDLYVSGADTLWMHAACSTEANTKNQAFAKPLKRRMCLLTNNLSEHYD
jgi:hypothetical protein